MENKKIIGESIHLRRAFVEFLKKINLNHLGFVHLKILLIMDTLTQMDLYSLIIK